MFRDQNGKLFGGLAWRTLLSTTHLYAASALTIGPHRNKGVEAPRDGAKDH